MNRKNSLHNCNKIFLMFVKFAYNSGPFIIVHTDVTVLVESTGSVVQIFVFGADYASA